MAVNRRKAQSAIEYFFTYGWMLVAVSMAGGAVYQTIGFECVEGTNGFVGADVSVQDFGATTSNQLDLVLQNNARSSVNITETAVSLEDGGEVRNTTGLELSQQEREAWSIGAGFRSSSEHCNTFDVEIIYDIGPLDNQITTGEITAQMDVNQLPGAPQNLQVEQTSP